MSIRHAVPRATVVALPVVLLAAVLAGCGSPGIVRTPAELVDIANPAVVPKQVWSDDVGNGSGGFYPALRIAAGKDAVFAGAEDGDAAAFDPKTGKRIWSVDTDARLIAGPTLGGDSVLFGTLDAKVVALGRAHGKTLWKGDASSEVMAAPASNGREVIVRSVDGRVYALNADSGQRVWSFQRNEPRLTLRGQSPPLILGDRVLIGEDNGTLVALAADSGKLLWQKAIAIPTGSSELERLADVDADLLAGADGVYVASYGGDIALVDPSSGDIRWKRHVKSYTGMALSADGRMLYVTDNDGHVWALDAATGAKAWEQKALQYRALSAPAFYDGYVVVGDFEGYLHWLSPTDGSIVGRTRLGSDPIIAPPVVADGLLFAMDSGGTLAAYKDLKPGA